MKNIIALMWLALFTSQQQAHAASPGWSESLKVQTCLAEIIKHLKSQARLGHAVRFEANSAQVQKLDNNSFVCMVVGTWSDHSHTSVRRETRAYYAAIEPLPVVKSHVGLVPTL